MDVPGMAIDQAAICRLKTLANGPLPLPFRGISQCCPALNTRAGVEADRLSKLKGSVERHELP